jgi:hypothetical protein
MKASNITMRVSSAIRRRTQFIMPDFVPVRPRANKSCHGDCGGWQAQMLELRALALEDGDGVVGKG